MIVRELIAEWLYQNAPYLEASEYRNLIAFPPRPEMGDYALPCFQLAIGLRKPPPQIAIAIADKLNSSAYPEYIDRIETQGGYLNFFINRNWFCNLTVDRTEQITKKKRATAADENYGRVVLVEYSSPNIAKPFHVGHAFSTVLGQALANIYSFAGYEVVRLNHLGDYGTQFGKLITAWEKWGNEERLQADPINELLTIYVRFHDEAKTDPQLEIEAREQFRALEDGGPAQLALWKKFREISLQEFTRVYERLGIVFDDYSGESFYSPLIPGVVEELAEKGLLEDSEGAKVVRLDDESLPPCIILKSDGSTIYASRDIAAAIYRYKKWNFFKNIYVVGLPQKLHFQQVFAVLDKAGYAMAKDCQHVGFGLVRLPEGKLSTREGEVIYLEDLLDEAVEKTRAQVIANAEERNIDMTETEMNAVAEKVGVGAIVFTFLCNGRERDIVFRWEDILDFDGDTAPYLQYTISRCRSILRRAEEAKPSPAALKLDSHIDDSYLIGDVAWAVISAVAQFERAVSQAIEENEPSNLSRQLLAVARNYNKFYNDYPILRAGTHDRNFGLILTRIVDNLLSLGLKLLGITPVERM